MDARKLTEGQVWKILDDSLGSKQSIKVLKFIRKSPGIPTTA